ncbi:MAG: sensor domain-containing phosphodiesterase [Thiomicrorhabdus sp.]|nr:sensor domain-containing phosphodiesterase [Thiomicrorhabdus sp.]
MKPINNSDEAFFKKQLTSSLGFALLLAIILVLYFQTNQWYALQNQTENYKQNYIHAQESALNDIVEQEYQHINALIAAGKFDEQRQAEFLQRLNKVRLGPNKTGYYFVLKLNDINGGQDFARHLILPPDASQIDQPMNSSKPDEMGNLYRQDYLQQLKETGKAKVQYWYQKSDSLESFPKVSVLRWIKPVNWIIGVGTYSDELEALIQLEKQQAQQNLMRQNITSIMVTLLILLLATLVNFKIQNQLKKRFGRLKKELLAKGTELKKLNDSLSDQVQLKTFELENLYHKDTVTQLFNRTKLLNDIEQSASNDEHPTTFLLLNIDRFKEVNELFGNTTGDLLLNAISLKLTSLFSENDKIYRTGADEFLVWLNQPMSDSNRQLPLLHHQLTQQIETSDLHSIHFNITIVAVCESRSPLNELEMTMRRAKQKGLSWLVYDSKYNQRDNYLKNLKVTEVIQQAILNDNVTPVFQPIYNIKLRKIEKFECLIRIKQNDKLLSPAEFLTVAKKSKLYPVLMQRMIEKSFAKFANSPYKFTINISYQDIEDEQIPKTIDRLLTPEIAKRVIFEILETEGIENYSIVSEFITKMKAQGCRIAVDDYGSGYSNLDYLLKLQIDFLKIDGSLVENLPHEHAIAVIKSIVFFANQLNILTVAEFVSNQTLFCIVSELGVDLAQGYYIGRPEVELAQYKVAKQAAQTVC